MRPRSTSKRCIEPPLPLTMPVPVPTAPSLRTSASPFSGCPFSADIDGPFPPRGTTLRTTNRITLFAASYAHFIDRFAQMYARFLGVFFILLLQPPTYLPEGPRPVRVFMLILTHLGVRETAPARDEDGVPPEPPLPPRLGRDLPPNYPLEHAHLPAAVRYPHRADGARRAVLPGEHAEDALVADAREKPLGERPRQAVPRPDDEPRVLDEDRVRRGAQGFAGGACLLCRDLGKVKGLHLGHVWP